MARSDVVEALLYGCTIWTPPNDHYTSSSVQYTMGCCSESQEPGASRRTSVSSPTKTPSNEPNAIASKQPCAQGGCCGRVRCSAWVTTGHPRGPCRESWRTPENIMDGLRRGRGSSAISRGTGAAPPHLTLPCSTDRIGGYI